LFYDRGLKGFQRIGVSQLMSQRIDVTVAAVIEHEDRFLLVEEKVAGELVLNQPAGHLEPGESLATAAVRETLEETGYSFAPREVVGIYLWKSEESGITFLRVAFCGTAIPPASTPRLDDGIVGVHWLSRSQLLSRRTQLRSPMVLRCIEDFHAGVRFPLACLTHLDAQIDARFARALA
jgi:8-oxo-dGTP pyrophosphatase MutT (NUDIX family)